MINRETFFNYVRKAPFGGRLTQSQIDGMNAILAEWERRKLADPRWLAYMLATAFHETGGRMQPVRETFARSDAGAIKALDAAWKKGRLKGVKTPYWRSGWFGRGLVQITHEENYIKFGIGKDEALDPVIAVRVLFDGMINGMFSRSKLADYFNERSSREEDARAIVNGTDKASLVASYYRNFLDAIEAATRAVKPVEVTKEAAQPDDVPAVQSKSLWTILATFLSGSTALPFLGNVSNGYALGAFALILLAAGIGAWLVASGRITINRAKAT